MLKGSMVALVTPMAEDGVIDYQVLQELVDFHVENGTSAIIAVGTTGESATLNTVEHCEVIKQIVQFSAGRIPIIAGTGANSTQEAIELTAKAAEYGADACLLVTPYYNKPTQEGLYQHFMKIADSVDIPQILYNVPSRTACDMLPATVARLAPHPCIVGIKEATGDLARAREIAALCGGDFALYSGDDETGMEFMLQGGHGVISVTTNVAPQLMADMCDAALGDDRSTAELLNENLLPLHQKLFLEANPIPVKWALLRMGRIPQGIRLPLTVLSEQFHAEIDQALQQAGVK